jgi:hypothetical protein
VQALDRGVEQLLEVKGGILRACGSSFVCSEFMRSIMHEKSVSYITNIPPHTFILFLDVLPKACYHQDDHPHLYPPPNTVSMSLAFLEVLDGYD